MTTYRCFRCGRQVPRLMGDLCADCYHAEEELKLRRQMAEDRRREDERRREEERQRQESERQRQAQEDYERRQREYEQRQEEWERAQAEEAECRRRAQEEARRREEEAERREAERQEREACEARRRAEAEQLRLDRQAHMQDVEARRQREVEEERVSNYKRWRGDEWVDKILVNPGVAKRLAWDDWNKLTGNDWVRLLLKLPRFAEDCNRDDVMGWFNFNGKNWVDLLSKRPEFAESCSREDVDGWSRLASEDWCRLLTAQPQFVEECRSWKDFNAAQILSMLSRDLTIANRIDAASWRQFSDEDYELLVTAYPELPESVVPRRQLPAYGQLDEASVQRVATIKKHWESGTLAEGKCPQCGKVIDPESVFCGHCGYLLKIPKDEPVGKVENLPMTSGHSEHVKLPNRLDVELVYCAPGEFVMGNEIGGLYSKIWVPHRVRLTKGFWIGKYPVTQAQWCRVMGDNPSEFKGGMRPVENVIWDAAQDFLARVGNGARLPTEAEWEYACRAGTDLRFSWGMSLNGDLARCNGTKPCGGLDKGIQSVETSRVDVGLPNRWGIYDFHGNVPEWCSDWYEEYTLDEKTDPVGPATGTQRVVRGGGWSLPSVSCTAMSRNKVDPSAEGIGMRLVFDR